jgi:hypothetical protein
MLGFRLRNMLLDALAAGPPYKVSIKQIIPAVTYLRLLRELERRGLITSGPDGVLTEAGIVEAKWFAGSAGADESLANQAR